MQGCQFVESHKSAGCGPVRSPETVPAREQTRKQTKNNKAKTGKTHNQNKNQTKTTESGIATSNGNYMHDDILCVILRMAQATRWLSWYGVGLASADRLPVVVRIPAGPLGSLKCDPPKGNGRRPQKKTFREWPKTRNKTEQTQNTPKGHVGG